MCSYTMGFPSGASGKEPACLCRGHKRCRFDPWVGKIPWRKAWQPTPVFLPGESHQQRSRGATGHRVAENQTRLKRLCVHIAVHLVCPLKQEILGNFSLKRW